MDARITKQRLSNLLSYDWLKILLAIAAMIGVLILIFTMIATRPTEAQTYSVYGYENVMAGSDGSKLSSSLEKKGVFSYDILDIRVENFNSNVYSAPAFTARRAAGEGTVMFISSCDGEGKQSTASDLYNLTSGEGSMYVGEGDFGGYYDPQYFFETAVKEYLQTFFGEELSSPIDKAAVRDRFLERNGKDKRFRSAEKKEAGVKSECERLTKLKDDYLFVQEAFGRGVYAYTALSRETGEAARVAYGEACPEGSYLAAIDMRGLGNISKLFYYLDGEGNATRESLNLLLFRNSAAKDYDLCYETVSFLRYLAEQYEV